LPLIYDPQAPKKHKLGLIRHFTHAAAPLRIEGVREIDVHRIGYDQIEAFIREVLESRPYCPHRCTAHRGAGLRDPTRWSRCRLSRRGSGATGPSSLDHYARSASPVEAPLDLAALDAVDQSLFRCLHERATKRFDACASAARRHSLSRTST